MSICVLGPCARMRIAMSETKPKNSERSVASICGLGVAAQVRRRRVDDAPAEVLGDAQRHPIGLVRLEIDQHGLQARDRRRAARPRRRVPAPAASSRRAPRAPAWRSCRCGGDLEVGRHLVDARQPRRLVASDRRGRRGAPAPAPRQARPARRRAGRCSRFRPPPRRRAAAPDRRASSEAANTASAPSESWPLPPRATSTATPPPDRRKRRCGGSPPPPATTVLQGSGGACRLGVRRIIWRLAAGSCWRGGRAPRSGR